MIFNKCKYLRNYLIFLYNKSSITAYKSLLDNDKVCAKPFMQQDQTGNQDRTFPLPFARPVAAAIAIMSEDISRHIPLKDLANKAGTNECTLKKRFKEMLHVTIYQYLVDQRMKKAYFLLTNTRLKELDIAMECGYESLPGFISTFRRYYGVSPGSVR